MYFIQSSIRLAGTALCCSLLVFESSAFAAGPGEGSAGQFRVPAQSDVAAEGLPLDARYWQYHEWYVNHSVLNVIVSGTDTNHLEETFRELQRMKKRGILIGDVAVVGASTDPSTGPATQSREKMAQSSRIKELIRDIGLGDAQVTDVSTVAQQMDVSFSPTWVVRYQGRNFVYEGLTSPAKLFTANGVFLDH